MRRYILGSVWLVASTFLSSHRSDSAEHVLIPAGASWTYNDSGSDLGTAWRDRDFDDATWLSGPAPLGYGTGDEATEISFGPDPNNKYPAYYFRHAFEVSDLSSFPGLWARLDVDDGAVAYLNGAEILRSNMPQGATTYQTLAVDVGETITVQRDIGRPDGLVAGRNVLAVEVHQANVTSSDLRFAFELVSLPWDPCITEVGESRAGADPIEWIELCNPGDSEIELDPYSLTFEDLFGNQTLVKFPGGSSVPAASYLAVCVRAPNVVSCRSICGDACLTLATASRGSVLDRNGGTVSLWWRPACSSAEELERRQTVRYPPLVEGASFGVSSRAEGPADEGAITCVQPRPTPGEPNETCPALPPRVVINEVSTGEDDAQREFGLSCSYEFCPDWVELYCPGWNKPFDLAGYRLQRRPNTTPPDASDDFIFPPGSVMESAYLVVICPSVEVQAIAPPGWLEGYQKTRYGLSRRGDSLVLTAPTGESDRVSTPKLECGEVYARRPDRWWEFKVTRATPGGENPPPVAAVRLECAVQILDRFPLRVLPGDDITVFAKIRSGDHFVEEETVRLLWDVETGGASGGEPMVRSKRITCERDQEEGIFSGRIPGLPSPTTVRYQVEATDSAGNQLRSEEKYVLVQPPNFSHPLRINEVAASGTLRPIGSGGSQAGHWVEIYNTSPTAWVDLRGLVLTNDVLSLNGRLDATPQPPIGPREYFVVWCTNEPSQSEPGSPHLPFRLNQCRDEVILLEIDNLGRKTGRVIDAVSFHEEKARGTLGRFPNGEDTLGLMMPTQGLPNEPYYCFYFTGRGDEKTVVINEVHTDNWEVRADARAEYGDWIELFHAGGPGTAAVDLTGWGLQDEGIADDDDDPWFFPEGLVLRSGERLLVWCDNDACEMELSNELHTNFELNRLNDFVELLDPDGNVVDRAEFSFQFRDVSLGRLPDGGDRIALLEPTPPLVDGPTSASGRNGSRGVREDLPEPRLYCQPLFKRGDANSDGRMDLADGVFILNWLFLGGERPRCEDAADADDTGFLELTDAVFIFQALFLGGAQPPEPGAARCGPDPTEDPWAGWRGCRCS